jgi:hypothetical protein
MASDRKTVGLPEKIYLINPSSGKYYSMSDQGVLSFIATPDYTCEVTVEYGSDNESFFLRSYGGDYFDYSAALKDYVTLTTSTSNSLTIPFTLLDLEAEDTFVFRADNGLFLHPETITNGQGLILSDFTSAAIKVSKTFIKRVVTDPVYDVNSATTTTFTPEVALKTTVRNDSASDSFTQTLEYSYAVSHVGTWTNTIGVAVSIGVSGKVDIPFLDDQVGIQVTGTVSDTLTLKGSETVTKTVKSTSTVAVPPNKKAIATVLILRATIDVPFTYTESTWYECGRFEEVTKSGIYHNIESYKVDVQVTDITSTCSSTGTNALASAFKLSGVPRNLPLRPPGGLPTNQASRKFKPSGRR